MQLSMFDVAIPKFVQYGDRVWDICDGEKMEVFYTFAPIANNPILLWYCFIHHNPFKKFFVYLNWLGPLNPTRSRKTKVSSSRGFPADEKRRSHPPNFQRGRSGISDVISPRFDGLRYFGLSIFPVLWGFPPMGALKPKRALSNAENQIKIFQKALSIFHGTRFFPSPILHIRGVFSGMDMVWARRFSRYIGGYFKPPKCFFQKILKNHMYSIMELMWGPTYHKMKCFKKYQCRSFSKERSRKTNK